MSIVVLLLSIVFALIEAGLCYLVLAYEPITSALSSVPTFLLTGGLFAVGMLLTFLLIIIIGFMNIRCHAGDYVRNYFGKTLALALIFTLIVGGLSLGAEALYQVRPPVPEQAGFEKQPVKPEIIDSILTPRRTYQYVASVSDIEHNVQNAGGNVDVPLRFSIQWSEPGAGPKDNNDVDAHSRSGVEHIYYSNKLGSSSGGELDVDVTKPAIDRVGEPAVENIMFQNLDRIKGKKFEFYIENYAARGGTTGFRAEIELGDIIYSYDYPNVLTHKQEVRVAEVTVDSDGNMSIIHHLTPISFIDNSQPAQSSSSEKSGFDFTSLVNSTVMRIVLVFLIAFIFKLVSSICIGKNDRGFLTYVLIAFVISILSALLLEFGYSFGLPVWAILAGFWILLSTLVVSAN